MNPEKLPLYIACSGGVDSMVLLFAASKIAKQMPVSCVHFTHDIRDSVETHKDWLVTASACDKYKIPFIHQYIYPAKLVKDTGGNLESAARDARYSFLSNLLPNPYCVATAHHRDDQIETVLMSVFQLGKIRKIHATRGLGSHAFLIRPMLCISKDNIVLSAQKNILDWHEDITNKDTRYMRNHVRHVVIPGLKERYTGLGTSVSKICGDIPNG